MRAVPDGLLAVLLLVATYALVVGFLFLVLLPYAPEGSWRAPYRDHQQPEPTAGLGN